MWIRESATLTASTDRLQLPMQAVDIERLVLPVLPVLHARACNAAAAVVWQSRRHDTHGLRRKACPADASGRHRKAWPAGVGRRSAPKGLSCRC